MRVAGALNRGFLNIINLFISIKYNLRLFTFFPSGVESSLGILQKLIPSVSLPIHGSSLYLNKKKSNKKVLLKQKQMINILISIIPDRCGDLI